MRLLLDTAAFLFAVQEPERLSATAQSAILGENLLELSVFALSEIAMKNRSGRLVFPEQDVFAVIESLQLRMLPYTAQHARQLFRLPKHHRDPFDRHIIAQALAEGIPVVTSDRAFRLYEGLEVIW